MGQVSTTILTSDGQIKATSGTLVWLTISAVATGGAVQINNSTDDSGTDVMGFVVPANSMTHIYIWGCQIRVACIVRQVSIVIFQHQIQLYRLDMCNA